MNNKPQQERSREEIKERRKRRRRILVELIIILVLILLLCLLLLKCTDREDASLVVLMPEIDLNAEDIFNRQDLLDAMQAKADASYFHLQINPEASFSSSTGKGSFEIVNPSTNVYPISVNLYLDEDNSLLYESGSILPNMQITSIELLRKLDPGTHAATAKVFIYNQTTLEKEGETQARIILTVT